MRHAGVGAVAVTGTRAIARAIAVVAEERAATMGPQPLEWPRRVGAVLGSCRIDDESETGPLSIELAPIPVGAPLPDIAGHVIKPVAVGWERPDGSRPDEAVTGRVEAGELALPDVGEDAGVGRPFVA